MKSNNRPSPPDRQAPGSGVIRDLRRLADRSLDGIYHYTAGQKRFVFFNRQFGRLFGLDMSDNRSAPLERLLQRVHPEDRQNWRKVFDKPGPPDTEEGEIRYRLLHADGTLKWLLDRWIAFRDGDTWAVEGFVQDVTEQKLAGEKLLDSTRNAPIGSFVVQDHQFKYVNAEFIRIIGYTEDELIGSDPFLYIHEDYREHVRRQAAAMLKRQTTTPYEFCIHHKGGEIRWIMETVTPIDFGGRRATLGYFMDITQLRQMQNNLSSLGLMIGTISHSLKGCLTGLDASLYLIETGFYRDKPARIEEGLDVTKLMVDRIRKLVLDVLYYAKERDLQLSDIEVWRFAKDVATSIEHRIRAANIHFECGFPADLGKFCIDTELLRPALINILENAMEACIEDPVNKQHTIRFEVRAEGDQVVFDISDNGPGFETDQANKIFRLFYSSKGNKGTGIGLFITRRVIHKHGGRVTASAEPGNGARFKIFLPRVPTAGTV